MNRPAGRGIGRRVAAVLVSATAFVRFAGLSFATGLGDLPPLLVVLPFLIVPAAFLAGRYPAWPVPGVAMWSGIAFLLFLLWATYLEISAGGTAGRGVLEIISVIAFSGTGAWIGRSWGRRRRTGTPSRTHSAEGGERCS